MNDEIFPLDGEVELVPITMIVIGDRARKDMGNLSELSESMKSVGMLHPVVCDSRMKLVAGGRRLKSAELLGWKTVPVRRVNGLDDAVKALVAEKDENGCRLQLKPTEMVSLGKRLRELEEPRAAERQGRPGILRSGNFPEQEEKGRTREKIASALDVSDRTYEKAEAVVDTAEQEPETYGDLPAKMDETGKVDRAHKEMKARKEKKTPKPKQTRGSDELNDANGNPVPERLRDLFGDPWLAGYLAQVDKWLLEMSNQKWVTQLKSKSQRYAAFLRAGDGLKYLALALENLNLLRESVAAGVPHTVCKKCQGSKGGCEDCRKTGWLPAWREKELHG